MEYDPLRFHGGTKAGMAWLMVQSATLLQESFPRITIPLILLHGGSDKIVDPEGTRMLYKESSSVDKEYKEYHGAYNQ